METEKEVVIPLEEAAAYARKRALLLIIGFVFLYLVVWTGFAEMFAYLLTYAKSIIQDFSFSARFLKTIFSPVIDLLSLFDFPILFVLGLFLGIFLHELLHGIPAAIYATSGFKSIRFGVYWKYLTPYTHFKEPLPLKKYKIVLLTPGIVLGILPAILGIFIQVFDLMMFGVVFSIGALGDVMVYERVKHMDNKTLVKDHPDSMGLIVIQ